MFPDHDNPASTTASGAAAAAAPEAENAAKDSNRQQHSAAGPKHKNRKTKRHARVAHRLLRTVTLASTVPVPTEAAILAATQRIRTTVPQADGDSQSPANTSSGSSAQGSRVRVRMAVTAKRSTEVLTGHGATAHQSGGDQGIKPARQQ